MQTQFHIERPWGQRLFSIVSGCGTDGALHSTILAVGAHVEHVEDAVAEQRGLDRELVEVQPQLTHGLVRGRVRGAAAAPVVDGEAAGETVVADADGEARADEVELPRHGEVPAGVAGQLHGGHGLGCLEEAGGQEAGCPPHAEADWGRGRGLGVIKGGTGVASWRPPGGLAPSEAH